MEMDIDNRFPLSFYYRIANQLVSQVFHGFNIVFTLLFACFIVKKKQAKVCREEENITDLYTVLKRYISLVSRGLSQHSSYSSYSGEEKFHHNKILKDFLKELEKLEVTICNSSPAIERKLQKSHSTSDGTLQNHLTSSGFIGKVGDRSLEGVNNLRQDSLSYSPSLNKTDGISFAGAESIDLLSIVTYDDITDSITSKGCGMSSRPSVLSCIQSVPHKAQISYIGGGNKIHLTSALDETTLSKAIHNMHIPVRLMEDFLEVARSNTNKNLETCGVLGAFLKKGTFYVTTLIIPKQESTSDSCQTLKEEEIFSIQDDQNLFPVGWIHTHPSQSCFMSSIDLHTHYSYQIMLPEAVAIVMAPSDESRRFGIFRLSDPAGTTVLKGCQERGFHPHSEPSDGSPIYEDCDNVYMNSNLRFEIIDLR